MSVNLDFSAEVNDFSEFENIVVVRVQRKNNMVWRGFVEMFSSEISKAFWNEDGAEDVSNFIVAEFERMNN